MNTEHRHGVGEEHPQSHPIQLFCFFLFIGTWITDTLILQATKDLGDSIPLFLRVSIFCFLLIIALLFLKSSHDRVLSVSEKSIVSDGVYSFVRHPMYFGTLLIYLACIILTFSLISVLPLILTLFLYDIIAKYEEKELERIIGDAYSEYMKNVHRWIPKIPYLSSKKR